MVSGHRKSKLQNYSEDFIRLAISDIIGNLINHYPIGISGMADGVDLWFIEEFIDRNLNYWSYIPFEGQDEYMSDEDKILRTELIDRASRIRYVRNSLMIEDSDTAIVVWDGNKGGTHNVIQQLIENKKLFYWINPVKEKIYNIE